MKRTLLLIGLTALAAAAAIVWWSARDAKRENTRSPIVATSTSAVGLALSQVAVPEPGTVPPAPPVEPSAAAPRGPLAAVPVNVLATRARDPGRPIEFRQADLAELASRPGAEAQRALMDLGEEDAYVNSLAVEALGRSGDRRAGPYLEGKLAAGDPKVAAAAARALAALGGARAVPALAAALRTNRVRPDGFEDTVCTALVEALGATRSAAAVPALAAELAETVGTQQQHEYGSRVVAALRLIGDPSAKAPLEAYVARLQSDAAGQADNPLGREYLAAKIREAREAADALR